ncbi:MAG: hypothetical protein IPP23_07280 [Sphingomonadales bacterium]|nr:hypothetical protein [Sphingomonadales bacterium]
MAGNAGSDYLEGGTGSDTLYGGNRTGARTPHITEFWTAPTLDTGTIRYTDWRRWRRCYIRGLWRHC